MSSNPPQNLPLDNVSIVVDKLLPPKGRLIVYVAVFIVIAALVVIGLIDSSTAAQWLFFAGNILGISTLGLVLANRPQSIKE